MNSSWRSLLTPLQSTRAQRLSAAAKTFLSTAFDAKYKNLAGTHRIQRVPPTEKNQRRHSSTMQIIWQEEQKTAKILLNASTVREEFIRTSGAGGQNKNKVSSCVRLTHIPTGTQVVADSHRHQGQNREDAWERLREKLSKETQRKTLEKKNNRRREQMEESRNWTWTEWRDTVKGPGGKKTSYKRALNGDLEKLL